MNRFRPRPAGSQIVPRLPIRVLFVDHTAVLSGGEIALLNLVRSLDTTLVQSFVLLGADGPLVQKISEVAPTYVDPLDASVRETKKDSLGPSSVLRLRAVIFTAAYAWRVVKFIRKNDIDVVHTNSLKADVIGGIAGRLS